MNYMGCRTVTINKHRFVINGVSIHFLMLCDSNEQAAPLLLHISLSCLETKDFVENCFNYCYILCIL